MQLKLKSLVQIPFLYILIFTFLPCISVSSQNSLQGYVIEKKENRIFIDLGNGSVNVGDRLKVLKEGGYFKHPVTGAKIKEEDEITWIDIIDSKSEYSIATTKTKSSYDLIKIGMKVYSPDTVDLKSEEFKKSVVVQPLTVSNVYGYLGLYISEVLTGELLESERFRVLDRSTLGIDNAELLASSNGLLSESDFLKFSNIANANYIITGTMYEPDVVEVSTGIPVKSLIQLIGMAVGSINGQDISRFMNASEYLPDKTEIKKLRAIVQISLKVIDVRTGDILFICTDMQEATGPSEINLEGGFLHGLKIKGGAASFSNTISGVATKNCLDNLLSYIFQFFDGEINTKNYIGNTIELSNKNSSIYKNTKVGQFVLSHYNSSKLQFQIGQIKGIDNDGRIYYEIASNDNLDHDYAPIYDYISLENDNIYTKVYNIDDLKTGGLIFMNLPNDRLRFGNFVSQINSNTINYNYKDWAGKTTDGQISMANVYTIKKGTPVYPYIHLVNIDSTYYYYNPSETRIVTAKVVYDFNSSVLSKIEFYNLKKIKQLVVCSNQDLYPLNSTFYNFKIKDLVYFYRGTKNYLEGVVIGYDPFNVTFKISCSNNKIYNIYYKEVNKVIR